MLKTGIWECMINILMKAMSKIIGNSPSLCTGKGVSATDRQRTRVLSSSGAGSSPKYLFSVWKPEQSAGTSAPVLQGRDADAAVAFRLLQEVFLCNT
jgi:hypothetical protein